MVPPEQRPFRQAAAAIVRRADGRVLLVRKPRAAHAWQFPQGGIEENESPLEAAKREFWEEIGTDKLALHEAVQGVFRYRYPPRAVFPAHVVDKERYAGQSVAIFVGDYLGTQQDIRIHEEELCGYAWVLPEELPRYLEDRRYLTIVQTIFLRCYGISLVPARTYKKPAPHRGGSGQPSGAPRRGGAAPRAGRGGGGAPYRKQQGRPLGMYDKR